MKPVRPSSSRFLRLLLAPAVLASGCALAGQASGLFEVQITVHPLGWTTPPPVSPVSPGSPGDPTGPGTPVSPPPGGGEGGQIPILPGAPGTPGEAAPPPADGAGPVAGGGAAGGATPAQPGVPATVLESAIAQFMLPGRRATPPGICSGQAQRAPNGSAATVNVVCSLGQYVTIEPVARQTWLDFEATERRFSFGPGAPLPRSLALQLNQRLLAGTVTALRISNLASARTPDSALEMLVSF